MSLKDRAILVSLSISKPKLTEKDSKASRDVAVSNKASTDAGAYVKQLYPKHLLRPIIEADSAARRYVESVTAPWARGLSLLPSALFMDFTASIGRHKIAFEQAVTVFLNNYANVLVEARRTLGDLYDSGAYPDLQQLRAQFMFSVTYYPMSSESDIVLKLEKGVLDDLRSEVAKNTKNILQESMKQVYRRLFDAVERVRVQCANPEGKIYDSLTGNMEELLRVLPALDLSDNPKFRDACRMARDSLTVRPEALRTQPEVREQVAAEAQRISDMMKGFM